MKLKQISLTPSQARELENLGFVVHLVQLMAGEKDKYEIGVKP